MSSIHYHSERATAERLVAAEAISVPAAIHIALAEMHEQLAVADINDWLAPLKRTQAWNTLARLLSSRSYLVHALRSAFQPLQQFAPSDRLRRFRVPTAAASTTVPTKTTTAEAILQA
jgi:hypothetical protein